MTINVLICTIDSGIEKVKKILLDIRPDVKYIVSHQYQSKEFKYIPAELCRKDVIVSQIPGKGLSVNRNNAIQLADGDIAVIADDDVTYLPDSFSYIKDKFLNEPELDVACFKIQTNKEENEHKVYPKQKYLLNSGAKHKIFSIEIAFRLSSIKNTGIKFDERFGLGSEKVYAGEEDIFIQDCIKERLQVCYYPFYIVCHPFLTSTRTRKKDNNYSWFAWGAKKARMHGNIVYPLAIIRLIRRLPSMVLRRINPYNSLKQMLRGANYILNGNS